MSDFSCPAFIAERVYRHPNADTLDIVEYEGYKCIVRRDSVCVGDALIYIPAQSILSDRVLDLTGMRNNPNLKSYNGERRIVKPVRLRGIFSEGLILPVNSVSPALIALDSKDDNDYSKELGIEKYIPPVPKTFQGKVDERTRGFLYGQIPRFDLESYQKKVPFSKESRVIVTEKLHGTQAKYGFVTGENNERIHYVTSKGVGKAGLSYALDDERKNVYVQVWNEGRIASFLSNVAGFDDIEACELTGEIVGVQDLDYGCKDRPTFFAFQFAVKRFSTNEWEYEPAYYCRSHHLEAFGIPTVPVLYVGPYSEDAILPLMEGKTTIDMTEIVHSVFGLHFGQQHPFKKADHIREGIVVVSMDNAQIKMKCVSETYKLRGNGTEHE